jgi:hypothetical protein
MQHIFSFLPIAVFFLGYKFGQNIFPDMGGNYFNRAIFQKRIIGRG